jgi:hypothetical protein
MIFPRLDAKALTAAAGVCCEWRQMVIEQPLWRHWGTYRRFHLLRRRGRAHLCEDCQSARARKHLLLRRRICNVCRQLPRNRFICKTKAIAMLKEAFPACSKAALARLLVDVPCLICMNPHGGSNHMVLYTLQAIQEVRPENYVRDSIAT